MFGMVTGISSPLLSPDIIVNVLFSSTFKNI